MPNPFPSYTSDFLFCHAQMLNSRNTELAGWHLRYCWGWWVCFSSDFFFFHLFPALLLPFLSVSHCWKGTELGRAEALVCDCLTHGSLWSFHHLDPWLVTSSAQSVQCCTAGRSGSANHVNMVVRRDWNSESAELCWAWSSAEGQIRVLFVMLKLHFWTHCALLGKSYPQGVQSINLSRWKKGKR